MKITDERKDSRVKFGTLDKGEIFKFDACVYIATEIYIDGDDSIDAISLESGEGNWIFEEDLVEPLDTELIIRG